MVMDSLNTMSRPYDIITFDCYGTLIDWRGGIAAAFAEAAQRAGRVCDISQILAMHAELEPEFQLRPAHSCHTTGRERTFHFRTVCD